MKKVSLGIIALRHFFLFVLQNLLPNNHKAFHRLPFEFQEKQLICIVINYFLTFLCIQFLLHQNEVMNNFVGFHFESHLIKKQKLKMRNKFFPIFYSCQCYTGIYMLRLTGIGFDHGKCIVIIKGFP